MIHTVFVLELDLRQPECVWSVEKSGLLGGVFKLGKPVLQEKTIAHLSKTRGQGWLSSSRIGESQEWLKS